MEQFSLNRLAGNLSQDEKEDLLKRIAGLDNELKPEEQFLSEEEIFKTSSDVTVSGYSDQSSLIQFFLRLLSAFTGRPPEKIWLKWQLKGILKYIVSVSPDLFNSQGAGFSDRFAEKINELRVLATDLKGGRSPDSADSMGAFALYCAQWEIPEVLRRVESSCNPDEISEVNTSFSFKDIKNEMALNLDTILNDIPAARLNELERNWKGFILFGRLVDLVSSRFYILGSKGISERSCLPVLKELHIILHAMVRSGHSSFLKYLYLFEYYKGDGSADNGECAGSVRNLNIKTEEFKAKTALFMRMVPLSNVIRYISSDPGYRVSDPEAVVSWKYLIKQNLQLRSARQFARFTYEKKISQLRKNVRENLGMEMESAEDSAGCYINSLQLINRFLTSNYRSGSYKYLSVIYYDGEFFRDENRNEFDTVFNYFNKACDRSFELLSSKDGDVNSDFVRNTGFQFERMQKLLVGIFFHSSQSGYDTLMNKKHIGGTSHESLKRNLKKFTSDLESCRKYLKSFTELESL